jgi:ABC-2 type transport system permease protein
MSGHRVVALAVKEIADLRPLPTIGLPLVLAAVAVGLPLLVSFSLPQAGGDDVASGELAVALDAARAAWPELAALGTTGAALQALIFAQFLPLLLLVPITAVVAAGAHSVVGERLSRALEPLLASPLTTGELLAAKVIGAMVPALAVELAGLLGYAGMMAAAGLPGVFGTIVGGRALVLVGAIGPLVTLIALQLTMLASTRTTDPRTAQQVGSLTVIPVSVVLVAQFAGALWLTTSELIGAAVVLALVWAGLFRASIALFARESILVRWR